MNQTDLEIARLHDVILDREAEIATLRGLLGKENQRANAAIDREETAEQAALEARQELDEVRAAASAVVSPPTGRAAGLSDVEREFLSFALGLAADHVAFRPNEFSDDARAALESLRRLAAEAQQQETTPASTAPLAAGLPLVKGNCPACGHASLFLGSGGYVTCSIAECREPDAASTVLERAGAQQQPDTGAPFATRVLEIFAKADSHGDLLWRIVDGQPEFAANVSDVFAWGGADAEDVTAETLPVLEQAFTDLAAIRSTEFVADLYAARLRKMRPQGAAYPGNTHPSWREVSMLFDACGPERELGLGNPKPAPAHAPPAPVAQQPAAEDTCRPVEIDGEIIRVRGAAEMSEESRAALAEVIAAAKRRYLAEHPEDEQQPAAADGEDTRPSPTAVLLATRCDTCQHTLNWHRNDVGCTVPLCVCGRFQPPTEEPQP